jgi:Domain of unknown function (DUF5666)
LRRRRTSTESGDADRRQNHEEDRDMRASTIALVLAAVLGLLSTPHPAAAHGTMKHVLGTVTEVQPDHVVVKTKDGGSQSIQRDAGTKYFRGDEAAKADDLAVGDRVVIHATPAEPPIAKTIKFTTPKASH